MGEAKLVADLIHTNIVQTYHLGEMSGQYFMTMEFINGINLEEFIDLHIKPQVHTPPTFAGVYCISNLPRALLRSPEM